ncbi:catalase family protein [Methylobacterium sp. Leaf89]|uniref:catalase family protein n=1 Tax=Methylobacterium sp. Leaf89 TaxID=1736245 RepID=UPI0006F608A0|nr:catalase family protein [Methylobacterium sp. Leaf89]KQO67394.1 catalase [Methylobacterium sp. Leaf89]
MAETRPPLRYSDSIEVRAPDEDATIAKIIAAMTHASEKVQAREHRAVRASHAKASAFLKGTLQVRDDLPPELRQGVFAKSGGYEVAVRLAQGPGEHLPDKVHTHRGMAIKVFGVQGETLPDHDADTQDFVLATGPVFPNGTAASFLGAMKGLEAGAGGSVPDGMKAAVSAAAGALNSMVKAVTGGDSPLLDFFGHSARHPLADCYYSQAALRYGDYIAKIVAVPVSSGQDGLSRDPLDTRNPDVFRDATVAYFHEQEAAFEIQVQLCTDLATMPVEDASVPWPEAESPYRPVARLVLPRQEAMGAARRTFMNDVMSFRPGHSLAAHRPLGSLMRARLRTYPALYAFRQRQNGNPQREPRRAAEIPD